MTKQLHQPVLLTKVLEYLAPKPNETYLDLTAGYGGHAKAVIGQVKLGKILLVDRDKEAVNYLRCHFKVATVLQSDYLQATKDLLDKNFKTDMVLLDVGVSSVQLENKDRGFSFLQDGPLDMRMDQSQAITAADIVNYYNEKQLADLIYSYGEERQSRRIARSIVHNRPINTTLKLAEVVTRAIGWKGRVHPATRTFQALRIAVNNELDQLTEVLPLVVKLLNDGGRLVVISFHSLEDRLVKNFIRDSSLRNLTKKVVSGKIFDVTNPRARSAKLRAAMKIKTLTSPKTNLFGFGK